MDQEMRRTWPLPFGERPVLEVDADALPVLLQPTAPGEAPSLEVVGYHVDRAEVEIAPDGNAVRARVRPSRRTFGLFWGVALRVVAHVPREVSARVRSDAGSIDARGLGPCQLDLRTGAGRIGLHEVHGRLRLSTDAGQVTGEDVGGSLEVRTDAGQVTLDVRHLDPGEHHVHTDVGAVSLTLRPGLDVQVEARAAVGSVRNEYPSRAGAAAVLRVSTEVGSVRVRQGVGPSTSAWERPPEQAHGPTEPSPPPPRPPGEPGRSIDPEVERILKMVEAGELTAREADELLRALNHE